MARLALAAHLTDGETEDKGTSWELVEDRCDIWFIGLATIAGGVRVVRMDFWHLFLKAEEVGRERGPHLH